MNAQHVALVKMFAQFLVLVKRTMAKEKSMRMNAQAAEHVLLNVLLAAFLKSRSFFVYRGGAKSYIVLLIFSA